MRLIKENYEKLRGAYERIMSIYDVACEYDSKEVWRDAYDTIFDGGYCRIVHECVPSFNWCDPDASYQDDVCAFVQALKELMTNIKVL